MLQAIGSTEIPCYFPKDVSEQSILPLLTIVNNGDLEGFASKIEKYDLNQVYDDESFPHPMLLSTYLLLRFLGFIDGDINGFPNAEEFIKIVLAKKPDLTFCIDQDYSFADFIKDRRQALIEGIDHLSSSSEEIDGYLPKSALLRLYEEELSQIELIAKSL